MVVKTRRSQQRSRSKSKSIERKQNTILAETILKNIEKNKQKRNTSRQLRPRLVIPNLALLNDSHQHTHKTSLFIHWMKHFFTIMSTFWLKRNIPLDYHIPCIMVCGLILVIYCYMYE